MDACQFLGVSPQSKNNYVDKMQRKEREREERERERERSKELAPKSATCNYIPLSVYNYIHFIMCV